MRKRLCFAVSAAVVLTAVSCAASATGTGQVPAAAQPITVWAQNSLSDSLTPVNAASGKAGAPVKLPSEPYGLAITPDGRTVYVMDGNDLVIPVSTATGRKGKP